MPTASLFFTSTSLALTVENLSSVIELGPSRPQGCKAIQSRPFLIKQNHHVRKVQGKALLTPLPPQDLPKAPDKHFSSEARDRGFFSAILQGTQPRVQPG